jgi:hypothetical protein
MDAHTQLKQFLPWNLINLYLAKTLVTTGIVSAHSSDYGFDFDEAEISKGYTPRFLNLAGKSIQEVEADEFEMRYRWFIS